MNDLITRFTSCKFLLALLSVIAVFFVPMNETQITAITTLIVAFTAAEGYADIKSRGQSTQASQS